MADENDDKGQGAGNGEKLDKLLDHLGTISGTLQDLTTRMDALEAKGKADDDKSETEKGAEARLKEERDEARDDSKRADSFTRRLVEDAELARIQSKADSAFNLHGKRAAAPLVGETPIAYRVRMASELRRFSPALDKVDLAAVARGDEAGFTHLEDRIYADSQKEAERPTMFVDDGIRMRERRNPDTGGPIREFFGPRTFVSEMSLRPRPVLSINREPTGRAA